MAKANLTDPEVDSDRARGLAAAKAKGTAPGIDPETGERANVTYRQLYNEFNGDEKRALEVFKDIARAGGYGDVDPNYAGGLDIRSLSRSVEDNKKLADRAEDLFERRQREQQAQHQDNVLNQTMEALEKGLKG